MAVSGEEPGCLPLLVTGVYRRGGEWRVEGEVTGVDRTIEVNLDASLPVPEVGKRLGIKVKRAKLFQLSEAKP